MCFFLQPRASHLLGKASSFRWKTSGSSPPSLLGSQSKGGGDSRGYVQLTGVLHTPGQRTGQERDNRSDKSRTDNRQYYDTGLQERCDFRHTCISLSAVDGLDLAMCREPSADSDIRRRTDGNKHLAEMVINIWQMITRKELSPRSYVVFQIAGIVCTVIILVGLYSLDFIHYFG